MPMPLSATASSTHSRPSATLRTRRATSPSFVNLQALLKRLSRICFSRMGSAVSAPTFSWASTVRRFWFFSASCPAVPMTSSISRGRFTGSGLSSSLPASIFDKSNISLMRLRRWVPAAFTRRSGSSAFSVPKRAALVTIISVRPIMALSGVRSSWLMLARNCDLCSLANCSWRFLSWISSNSRTFSIAITAWSAKVVSSSICLSLNGATLAQQGYGQHRPVAHQFLRFREIIVRVCLDVRNLDRAALQQRAAGRGSAPGADRSALPELQAARRGIVGGGGTAAFAIVAVNHAVLGAANADGILQQRLKDALEVERRPADGLKHLGRGGLLPQT